MNRILAAARPCVLLFVAATFAAAQQTAPAPPSQGEFGPLKQAVEQQSKQIEALTQQIAELNRRMSGQKEAAATPAPATAPASEAPATIPSATSAATPGAVPPPSTPQPTTVPEQKPEAPVGGEPGKHTVAKGETLTSIAKRYNIPLSELEKANKITDDRKLQIGHVLNIPTTANKAPEPPTEKKENP